MSTKLAKIILNSHSVPFRNTKEGLLICDGYCKNGKAYENWVKCPTTLKSLRNFLGY